MRNTVRLERQKKEISQQELAKLLSVSPQTIMAIEARRFIPSTKLSLKLAAVLDCNIQDLFILEDGD